MVLRQQHSEQREKASAFIGIVSDESIELPFGIGDSSLRNCEDACSFQFLRAGHAVSSPKKSLGVGEAFESNRGPDPIRPHVEGGVLNGLSDRVLEVARS